MKKVVYRLLYTRDFQETVPKHSNNYSYSYESHLGTHCQYCFCHDHKKYTENCRRIWNISHMDSKYQVGVNVKQFYHLFK